MVVNHVSKSWDDHPNNLQKFPERTPDILTTRQISTNDRTCSWVFTGLISPFISAKKVLFSWGWSSKWAPQPVWNFRDDPSLVALCLVASGHYVASTTYQHLCLTIAFRRCPCRARRHVYQHVEGMYWMAYNKALMKDPDDWRSGVLFLLEKSWEENNFWRKHGRNKRNTCSKSFGYW